MRISRKLALLFVSSGLLWGSVQALPLTIPSAESHIDAAKVKPAKFQVAQVLPDLAYRPGSQIDYAGRPEFGTITAAQASVAVHRSAEDSLSTAVAEPSDSTLLLAGIAMLGLIVWRRLSP